MILTCLCLISLAALVESGPPKWIGRPRPYPRPQSVIVKDHRLAKPATSAKNNLVQVISRASDAGNNKRTDGGYFENRGPNPNSPLQNMARKVLPVPDKPRTVDAGTQTGLSRLAHGNVAPQVKDATIVAKKPDTVLGKVANAAGSVSKQAVALGVGGAIAGGIASAVGGNGGNLVINLQEKALDSPTNTSEAALDVIQNISRNIDDAENIRSSLLKLVSHALTTTTPAPIRGPAISHFDIAIYVGVSCGGVITLTLSITCVCYVAKKKGASHDRYTADDGMEMD